MELSSPESSHASLGGSLDEGFTSEEDQVESDASESGDDRAPQRAARIRSDRQIQEYRSDQAVNGDLQQEDQYRVFDSLEHEKAVPSQDAHDLVASGENTLIIDQGSMLAHDMEEATSGDNEHQHTVRTRIRAAVGLSCV
jgi:hypothetical protein